MAAFQRIQLRHTSNKATAQDGMDVFAVRKGGKQVWAHTTGENFSRLEVAVEDGDVLRAAREIEIEEADTLSAKHPAASVGTFGTGEQLGLRYSPEAAKTLAEHVGFLSDETTGIGSDPGAREAYLWDALKMALGVQVAASDNGGEP